MNQISIAPVQDIEFAVKQKVYTVPADHLQVEAQVSNGVMKLNRAIQKQKKKSLKDIHQLQGAGIGNGLAINSSGRRIIRSA